MSGLDLTVMSGTFAICRLGAGEAMPMWATVASFVSITRTKEELSIVCEQERMPVGTKMERDWSCLKVEGPLDFALTGILANLSTTLTEADISLFAISTFDTDYLLVKQVVLDAAVAALTAAGHQIHQESST